MGFPFVLRRTYEDLKGDAECMIWSLNRQLEQMDKEREGLILRITQGEQYREGLESRLYSVLEDNRLLSETRAEARQQLAEAKKQVQKLTMLNKSLESMWAARAEEKTEA